MIERQSNPSKQLRILFLGDPRLDRRVQCYGHAFQKAGWDVELVGAIRDTNESVTLDVSGIPAKLFALPESSGPRMFLAYHFRLKRYLASARRAAVTISSDLYSLGVTANLKREGRTDVALFDSREVYTELPTTAHRPLVRAIWHVFEHRNMRPMDGILVTGPHDLEAIFETHGYSPRSFLVRNIPELEEHVVADASLRTRLGISVETPLFVYVGGLQVGRGLEAFLRAFQKVELDSHFVVIGDGVLREKLQQLTTELHLGKRVTFLGPTAASSVLSMLAACDVGVNLIEPVALSYVYALPSKLFEYMMAGILTLTSPLLQVQEIFPNEPWLLTAVPTNESEIVEKCREAIRLSKDPNVRALARERAVTQYHFEREIAPLVLYVNHFFEADHPMQ